VQGSLSYPANRFPFGNNRGIHGTAGESDLVLRTPHRQFEVYNIANNQITGAALSSQVGLDWQLSAGLAVDSPIAAARPMA